MKNRDTKKNNQRKVLLKELGENWKSYSLFSQWKTLMFSSALTRQNNL